MPDNLKTRIALSMIVRGDGVDHEKMNRALESIVSHVDAVYVTITGPRNLVSKTEEVLKKYNVNISYNESLWEADKKAIEWLRGFFGYEPEVKEGDKLFMFDSARNYAMDQIPKDYDWLLWMDSDDIFVHGEKLHELAQIGIQQDIEAFYFNYLYQAEFDEKGNIKHRVIEHLRERLLRNSGVYKWIAPIHETLIEQRPTRKTDNYDCEVIHLATDEDRINSLRRNLKNLELSIYQTKGKDPRPIYYLAKALFDIRTTETDNKAVPLMMRYLLGEDKSGWPEERAQAWEYLSEIYRRKGEFNNAIKSALNAFTEPSEPSMSPFLSLALSFMNKQQWDLALFWVKLATQIPEKKTTLVKNIKDLQGRTLEIIYNSCMNLSKVDEAYAAAVKLVEMYPDDPTMRNAFNFISQIRAERDISMQVTELANFLKSTGEREKIKSLLNSVPQIAQNNPFITQLYKENNPPKAWGEKEVAIYCGPGFTNWSPKQLDNPGASFVGGSEEAVINISRELTKLGWEVTVYGDPGSDEGVHQGVTYLPYYKFNKLDNFNILISWRQLGFFDQDYSAKKKYLWCHDLLNKMEFTPERYIKIDKIIVLSKYHRDQIDNVPDDRIFISTNGINLTELNLLSKTIVKRDPHKIFYGSSYDRGLLHTLEMWPEIRKAVPDATLEIAYGWQLFDQFYKDNPASMKWKEKMENLMKQEGITDHGRLSQPVVAQLMQECSIWGYSTHFAEINCINAIKSQALGLEPVVVNYAALQETVQFGRKIDGDVYDPETKEKFKRELIDALKNPMSEDKRQEMMKWANDKYQWSKIASEWEEIFNE